MSSFGFTSWLREKTLGCLGLIQGPGAEARTQGQGEGEVCCSASACRVSSGAFVHQLGEIFDVMMMGPKGKHHPL